MIKSNIDPPEMVVHHPPSIPPKIFKIVRHNAPRPLPALFAIVLLVGAMLLLSMAMSASNSSEGTPTVAAEASLDE